MLGMMHKDCFFSFQRDLFKGKLSLVETVNTAIKNIKDHKNLNAYIHVFEEEALEQAQYIDDAIYHGKKLGKLAGMIVSVKDVIAIKDKPVTAGSKILEGYVSPYSSTIIERLSAEDAIIIGTTNCDEFAMGSANQSSHYGPAKNALFPDRVPGGSSGGTAISVAIDSCHVGIGSDTGGSIRQPAAFHGLFGYKPSYGRLSRHGLLAYASSFDQVGFIAQDKKAIQLLYHVVNGPDAFDSTLLPKEEKYLEESISIGYLHEALNHESLNAEIKEESLLHIERLKQDYEVAPFHFELLDYLVQTYYVLAMAEASSNLSRYDGVRYGYRSPHAKSLEEVYTLSRTEGFGLEVKRRIMVGSFVLSAGYKEAYFTKAQQVRAHIVKQFSKVFEKHNIICLPISPVFPWKQEEKLSPVEVYLSDIFSVIPNLIGAPAYQVPISKSSSTGLPIGFQYIAKPGSDAHLLKFLSSQT